MSAGGFLGGLVQGFQAERQFQLQKQMFEREQALQEKQFDFFSAMKQKEFDQNTAYLQYKAGVEQKRYLADVAERKAQLQQGQQRIDIDRQQAEEQARYHRELTSLGQSRVGVTAATSTRLKELDALIAAAQRQGMDPMPYITQREQILREGGVEEPMLTGGQEAAPAAPAATEQPAQAEDQGPPADQVGQEQAAGAPQPSGADVMTATMVPTMVRTLEQNIPPGGRPPASAAGAVQAANVGGFLNRPQGGTAAPSPKAAAVAARANEPEIIVFQSDNPAADKEKAKKANEDFKLLKRNAIAVTQDEIDEDTRKRLKAQYDKRVLTAKMADQQTPTIQDELNRRGIPVVIDAVGQRNTHVNNYLAARTGLFGAGGSVGLSEGYSEIEAPKVQIVANADTGGLLNARGRAISWGMASPRGFFNDPKLAGKIVSALADINAQSPETVSMPIIEGTQDFIRQGQAQLKEMLQGKRAVKDQPFAAVLEPMNTTAIQLAQDLEQADKQLAQIASGKGPYKPVGPFLEVKPGETHPVDVLDRFRDAVDTTHGMLKTIGHSGEQMRDVESKLLGELQQRLRPDQKDGTFGKAAQERAKEVLQQITENSNVSDEMKAQISAALMPVASGVAKGMPPETEQRPKGKAGKEIGQAGGAGIGPMGFLRMGATMAALGGQDQVNAINAKYKEVPNAKNKEDAAIAFKREIENNVGQMTDAEKKSLRTKWNGAKGTWKTQYKISDDTISAITELLKEKK